MPELCFSHFFARAGIRTRPPPCSLSSDKTGRPLRCPARQRAFTLVEFDLSGMDENAEICMASVSMQQTDRGVNVRFLPISPPRFHATFYARREKTGRPLSDKNTTKTGRQPRGLPSYRTFPGRRRLRLDGTRDSSRSLFPPVFQSFFPEILELISIAGVFYRSRSETST